MLYHVAQYLTGIFVVIAELRTTVIVRERNNSVDPFTVCFFTKLLGQLIDNSVYATDCRDNPYLVTYTHLAVFTTIPFESKAFIGL